MFFQIAAAAKANAAPLNGEGKIHSCTGCVCIKWCHTDASRKRAHDEESEGGPAVKKPAGEHGECMSVSYYDIACSQWYMPCDV